MGISHEPRTLLIGGQGRTGCCHSSVDELLHGAAEQWTDPFGEVVIQPSIESLHDAWAVLRRAHEVTARTGILTIYSDPEGEFEFPEARLGNLLSLAGFEQIKVSRQGNKRELRARPKPHIARPLSCSVVVPCRNELENIRPLVERVPDMGTETEIIFVDGASTDGTPECIGEIQRERSDKSIKLLHQHEGGGKAAATFQGFDAAEGDVLIILDADMTVAPEDLPRFFLAIAERVTDVANGNRLVYPMEAGAMPAANLAGNKLFAVAISWLVSSSVGDTLCGTKALLRADWREMNRARARLGGHDPWGDFDLLLGAAMRGLRIMDVPVRYWARSAGESKMQPFRHAPALARTCLAGMRELKLTRR